MTEPPLPERILLASDMSARCDRALQRAALLAQTWRCRLDVLHAVQPAEATLRGGLASDAASGPRPRAWTEMLERRLREDLAAEGVAATSRVVLGPMPQVLLEAVGEDAASLVVLGIAGDAGAHPIRLGGTADSLVRRSPVPVLNVRKRVRGAYRHVVVASDFSAPSLQALRLAAQWFGQSRLTLFHAHMPPGYTPSSRAAATPAWREPAMQQCAAHVAQAALPAPVESALARVIEYGAPQALLADYVLSADVDLVVLGSHGRTGIGRVLLGSTAAGLLHALDCDTLVVRGA